MVCVYNVFLINMVCDCNVFSVNMVCDCNVFSVNMVPENEFRHHGASLLSVFCQ